MKKNLLLCFLIIVGLILSHKYVCLREKCDELKLKTQNLGTTRLYFENLSIKNKQLQKDFNACCLPRKQTIALMEGLIDKNIWDEFAHDWCLAPEEIKTRFYNMQNHFFSLRKVGGYKTNYGLSGSCLRQNDISACSGYDISSI